jgi:hypothetical protein
VLTSIEYFSGQAPLKWEGEEAKVEGGEEEYDK